MLNLALNNKRPVVVLARPGGLMQAVLMFLGVSRRSNCSVRKKVELKYCRVDGDNLVERGDLSLETMTELQTGTAYPTKPASSNAYFGAASITESA